MTFIITHLDSQHQPKQTKDLTRYNYTACFVERNTRKACCIALPDILLVDLFSRCSVSNKNSRVVWVITLNGIYIQEIKFKVKIFQNH